MCTMAAVLRQLVRALVVNRPRAGIYALLDGETVMYVVESQDVPQRIRRHVRDGKPFTAWRVLVRMPHSQRGERRAVESRLIRERPPWNRGRPYREGPAWRARERIREEHEARTTYVTTVAACGAVIALVARAPAGIAMAGVFWVLGRAWAALTAYREEDAHDVRIAGPFEK